MQYDVAEAATLIKLLEVVNSAISGGWRPQGGIAVVNRDGKLSFIQAMVRD
ncbi:MAG TPA: hypothetical protein VKB12_09355 [Pyrinomonadaceae bacterium]|nr:hypothetical protein [Pyrinomonadaceae bacterium]